MSNFEPTSWCPVQEFDAWMLTRVRADQLALGAIYTGMSLLAVPKPRAIKFPIAISSVNSARRDTHIVTFAVLDDSGNDMAMAAYRFWEGLGSESSTRRSRLTFDDLDTQTLYIRGDDSRVAAPWRELGVGVPLCSSYVSAEGL